MFSFITVVRKQLSGINIIPQGNTQCEESMWFLAKLEGLPLNAT